MVSTVVLILALQLTSGNAAKYFSATLGLVISMVTITYVLIFPAVIKLRHSYPDVVRPYRIPGRHGRAVDRRDLDHRLGGVHHHRDYLSRHRHGAP